MDSDVKLSETSLRVYILLLREGRPMSIREVQKALGLSSPGQAYHHLERLRMLGLVVRDSEGYRAVRRGNVVDGAVIVRSSILPRASFYMGFSASLTITYAIMAIMGLVKPDAFAVVSLAALLTFSTIEFRDQFVRLRRPLRY